MGLNPRVATSVFIIAVLALSFVFYVSSSSIEQGLADAEKLHSNNAKSLARSTSIFLARAYGDFSVLSENPVLTNEVSGQSAIEMELREFKYDRSYVKSISFYNLDGIKIAGTDSFGIGNRRDLSEFTDDFAAGKKYSFQPGADSSASNPVINAAFPVQKQGMIVGIITAELDALELKNIFGATNASIALIDKEGEVIISNTPLYSVHKKLSGMDSVKEASTGKSGALYEQNQYLGGEVFTAYAAEEGYGAFGGSGWAVIYSVEKAALLAQLNSFYIKFAFIALLVLLFALAISYYLSKEFEKPLKEIKQAAQDAMSGKDFRIPKEMGANTEETMKYFESVIRDLGESKKVIEQYSRTMDQQVGTKTKDLEDTKAALVNALGDVTKTKERITKGYTKLKEQSELKDQFISIAAHELKSPLSIIHGFSDVILKTHGADKEKTEKYLKIISNEAIRLSQLVTDILDLSRVDLGTVKYDMLDTDPKGILADMSKSMQMQIEQKGLKYEAKIDKKLPKVSIDRDKFTQVVVNLLTNSMKYTLKGTVRLRAFNDDGNLHVLVEDTGIGMSKQGMKKLFQRFYRVETDITKKIQGTGLGLSLCKEYIEAMGGKIWAESVEGKGSKFHVLLPGK